MCSDFITKFPRGRIRRARNIRKNRLNYTYIIGQDKSPPSITERIAKDNNLKIWETRARRNRLGYSNPNRPSGTFPDIGRNIKSI